MIKHYFLALIFTPLILITIFSGCSKSGNDEDNQQEIDSLYALFVPTRPPDGYPNADNTGLIDPSVLSTDLSSLNEVSLGWEATDNQVVENLEIRGRLLLNGNNITVRNCRLWGDEPNEDGFAKGYAVQIFPDPLKDINVVIENCEIGRDPDSWPNHILGIICSIHGNANVHITVRNNLFRYLHDGIFFASTYDPQIEVTIEDNYFVYLCAEDGEEGHDIDDHKGDGFESNGPLYNSVIRHNSIDVPTSQTSCILVQSNWGDVDNILIHDNWLNGASYSLKVRKRTDTPYDFTNVTITDNLFGRDYSFGPFDAYDFKEEDLAGKVTGNRWADTYELIEEINR